MSPDTELKAQTPHTPTHGGCRWSDQSTITQTTLLCRLFYFFFFLLFVCHHILYNVIICVVGWGNGLKLTISQQSQVKRLCLASVCPRQGPHFRLSQKRRELSNHCLDPFSSTQLYLQSINHSICQQFISYWLSIRQRQSLGLLNQPVHQRTGFNYIIIIIINILISGLSIWLYNNTTDHLLLVR